MMPNKIGWKDESERHGLAANGIKSEVAVNVPAPVKMEPPKIPEPVRMSPPTVFGMLKAFATTIKQKRAAKRNIKIAQKASIKIAKQEHRVTHSKSGRKVQGAEWSAKKKSYLYLGRNTPDMGKPGYDTLEDVRNTLEALSKDYRKGYIGPATANRRTMRLKAIVEQNKKPGNLSSNENKKRAIRMINRARQDINPEWKPLSQRTGPQRPTYKQQVAARKNVMKAQAKRW